VRAAGTARWGRGADGGRAGSVTRRADGGAAGDQMTEMYRTMRWTRW
jgi:hypothetical protein